MNNTDAVTDGTNSRAARNRELHGAYHELLGQLATGADALVESRLETVKAEVVETNRGLVVSIARKYRPFQSPDFDDYLAAGMLGLWEAFTTWDPTKAELSTWAYRHIEGLVRRSVAANEFDGTYHDWSNRPVVLRTQAELRISLGREPSPEEIAKAAGVGIDVVVAVHRPRPVALDAPVGDNDRTVGDVIADDYAYHENAFALDEDVLDTLATKLTSVPADQIAALVRCKGIDGTALDGAPVMSTRAAARLLGFNKENVRERINKALAKLSN